MISGVLDRLVPPYVAHDYARAMRAQGKDSIELVNIEGAGHFDLATPGTPAWDEVWRRIEAALGTASADHVSQLARKGRASLARRCPCVPSHVLSHLEQPLATPGPRWSCTPWPASLRRLRADALLQPREPAPHP
jgi:hypothetical protein